MNKQLIAVLSLCLAGALVSGAARAELVKTYEGWKLYNSYCYLCHGSTGKGNGPLAKSLGESPADLTSDDRLGKRSDRELLLVIQGNAPHGKLKDMPQWGQVLPEPQIQALVSYLRFLHRSRHPLTGNPEQGRELYARYCVACHGTDGKGQGVMTKVLPIKPRNHTDAVVMNAMDNRRLSNIILYGDAKNEYMPAWEGYLSKAEVDAVVSYLRLLSHNQ
jgi:cytochrome c oxidase cbb3-type subunit 3